MLWPYSARGKNLQACSAGSWNRMLAWTARFPDSPAQPEIRLRVTPNFSVKMKLRPPGMLKYLSTWLNRSSASLMAVEGVSISGLAKNPYEFG